MLPEERPTLPQRCVTEVQLLCHRSPTDAKCNQFALGHGLVQGGVVRIAIAGASGFVGRALAAALTAHHDEVIAVSRHPPELPGVVGRAVDVADEAALREVLAGCDVAFYLVHSLAEGDFRARDRQLAEGFGTAAAAAGIDRIVYLGGLGQDPGSEHLASRQEVGSALGAAGVPVVELRAAVVLGAGSISFEMLRYLTERLPFMVCPRWVRTTIQPIALADLIDYLVGALKVAPGVYEIGGSDVTTYREMIAVYASVRGLRRRPILDVPYLTPRLSSYWLDLVTPVDRRVSHTLVESLVTEVVVKDQSRTDAAFGIEPVGLIASLTAALDDQARALDTGVLDRPDGLRDGIYTIRVAVPASPARSSGPRQIWTGSAAATAGTAWPCCGGLALRSAAWSANGYASALPRRSFPEHQSTGGSSPAETPASWSYAVTSGSPAKDGWPIATTTTNSSKSARFARKASRALSIGSSYNQSTAPSSLPWRIIGPPWRPEGDDRLRRSLAGRLVAADC